MRRLLTQICAIAVVATFALACAPKGTTLKGRVMCDNKPVAGVVVSDGEQVVQTNERGYYYLSSTKPYGTIFISTPSGYAPQMKDGVRADFWAHTTAEAQVCERHDFNLREIDDKLQEVLFLTDTHFCNDPKREDFKYFRELAMPAINRVAEACVSDKLAICLGDITWDRFWYATGVSIDDVPQHLISHNFPMPFYCVHGNHDYDPSVGPDQNPNCNAIKRFVNTFGPTFYSFNRGNVHFVMLDNIVYKNEIKPDQKVAKGVVGSRNYDLYVEQAQLEWLKRDLALVDKSSTLVVCMHAPLFTYNGNGEQVYSLVADNAEALVDVVKEFESVKFFTGHSHRTMSFVHPQYPHIVEYNLTSIGGDLWNTPSKWGVTIGEDGADAGFYLCTFSEQGFSRQWHSTEDGNPYPFRVYDMNVVAREYKSNQALKHLVRLQRNQTNYAQKQFQNYIYINCWAWEQGSTLAVTQDDKQLVVEKVTHSDPMAAKMIFAKPSILKTTKESKKINRLSIAPNMFRAKCLDATGEVVVTLTTPTGGTVSQTFKRPIQ